MMIKRKGQWGGAVIVGAILVAGAGMGWGVNQVRIGGPVQQQSQLANDLIVEVAPTTLYVAEPFVEVTRLARAPRLLGEMRPLLDSQKKSFADNEARFGAAPLPAEVKAAVARDVATGRAFWAEVDGAFLPAVARGDRAAIDASYARVEAAFVAHQQANAGVMATGTALRTRLAEQGDRVMALTLAGMAVIGLILIALLTGAFAYLLRAVINPIAATAEVMERMAGGDYGQAIAGTDRRDEIGMMTRSIEVFRAAGQERARHEAEQQDVVRELGRALNALAAGDFSHRIVAPFASTYETLREAFNQTLAQLNEVLGTVSHAAQSVSSGATEIRAASDDLARRTEQQAATLEQTTAAMRQVTEMVAATAASANGVTQAIGTAGGEARQGAESVERAVAVMDRLEASSREIAQITNVIDGIAFQTNLLALNAGVEAARAGDAGRLRGRRDRGARARPAFGGGGQGHQGADRRLHRAGRYRRGARARKRRDPGADRRPGRRGERDGRRDRRSGRTAGEQFAAGERRRRRDGPGDAAERGDGGRGDRRRAQPIGRGRGFADAGRPLQARRSRDADDAGRAVRPGGAAAAIGRLGRSRRRGGDRSGLARILMLDRPPARPNRARGRAFFRGVSTGCAPNCG